MVETVSVLAGSVILLGLFLPIAYEDLVTNRKSKEKLVSALNYEWQKLTVSAR
ncbi:MAG: hypothetical protein WA323_15215 [Candidatus Nitrosopolaris sp.]